MLGPVMVLRAVPVLVLLAGLALLLRRVIVGWLYESKPKVRRWEWRSEGSAWGPAEVRRLAELQAGIERRAR